MCGVASCGLLVVRMLLSAVCVVTQFSVVSLRVLHAAHTQCEAPLLLAIAANCPRGSALVLRCVLCSKRGTRKRDRQTG